MIFTLQTETSFFQTGFLEVRIQRMSNIVLKRKRKSQSSLEDVGTKDQLLNLSFSDLSSCPNL